MDDFVPEPARIIEPAESISVTAGDSATLECTISGSPELKVKWFRDGKEMISGRKYKMTLKDTVATMKILTADKGDTSEYKMEVSNKVGKDRSAYRKIGHVIFFKKLKGTRCENMTFKITHRYSYFCVSDACIIRFHVSFLNNQIE